MSQYTRPDDGKSWGYQRPPGMAGVLTSRFFAFLVDAVCIFIIFSFLFVILVTLGFVTFGLTWLLLPPLFWLTALFYNGILISGRRRATFGMRLFGIELVNLDGHPLHFLTAAVHAVLFYISVSVLTPFILLVGLVRDDRRMLHDLLTGAIAYRAYD